MTSIHHAYRGGQTCSLPRRLPGRESKRVSHDSHTQSEQPQREQDRAERAQAQKWAATTRAEHPAAARRGRYMKSGTANNKPTLLAAIGVDLLVVDHFKHSQSCKESCAVATSRGRGM